MMDEKIVQQLIRAARQAQERAYAPYSKFHVGAALLSADGTIYQGCNVENASYGLSICAERNALFHAVTSGCQAFTALAITGSGPGLITPCGACRQVLAEFHVPTVILTKADNTYKIVSLQELLPYAFDDTSMA